ncbi:hypothetical protein EBZ39_06910 [bacterium]|nr:hypothetical protein [bacterium]
MGVLSVAAFLELVSPLALMVLCSVGDLVRLKNVMQTSVCCGKCAYSGTGKYPCNKCTKLKQKMWSGYHDLEDPEHELVCRIAYEYLFGIIGVSDIAGRWLDSKIRDPGHHERVCRLVRKLNFRFENKWLKPSGCCVTVNS